MEPEESKSEESGETGTGASFSSTKRRIFSKTTPFCPECKRMMNNSTLRSVRESCGHSKCRQCCLSSTNGCKQCLLLQDKENASKEDEDKPKEDDDKQSIGAKLKPEDPVKIGTMTQEELDCVKREVARQMKTAADDAASNKTTNASSTQSKITYIWTTMTIKKQEEKTRRIGWSQPTRPTTVSMLTIIRN